MSRFEQAFAPTLLTAVVALALGACAGNWPIENRSLAHPIGNSGGEFQQYTGAPYFHTGIDIVSDDPAPGGPFVLNNRSGTIVLSEVGPTSLYNGVTLSVGDASGSTQKYWHLDSASIQQAVRDADANNTVLPAWTQVSRLVDWTACSYHHLHFETCDNTGCTEPVLALRPRSDTNGPVIVDVQFTNDGSTSTFPSGFPDTVVSGRVDIVARAYDRQFTTATQNHKTGVLRIGYVVEDLNTNVVVHTGATIDFSTIPSDATASTLFRLAAPYASNSDYCADEQYFYVVTNVDPANATSFGEGFAWDTTAHPNGRYRVRVTATDQSGNFFSLSKQVRIAN